MNLKDYENKLVRLIDSHNNIFEGIAVYNSEEFNEKEYGKKEESIQILYYNFYKNHIYHIEEIEDYSSPYGFLEEMILQDGISFIEDLFAEEKDEILLRLLKCIHIKIYTISYKNQLFAFLKKELKKNHSEAIKEEIETILKK